MRIRITTNVALVVTLISISTVPAQEANPPTRLPTIEQILRVWRARQEKVRSAHFEYDIERTIYKGFLDAAIPNQPHGSAEPNPPQDYVVNGTGGVAISGQKLRNWCELPSWDPTTKSLYPSKYLDTFNGVKSKNLFTPADGQVSYSMGTIRGTTASQSAVSFPIAALLHTFRGDHPEFFSQLGKYTVTRQSIVATRPCVELVKKQRTRDERDVFYLDLERGFVVVRKATLVGGEPTWQLDVKYRPDNVIEWVPSSWEYMIRFGKRDTPFESARYTVTRYILNPQLDASEFDIEFAPGTRVVDYVGTKGESVQYVVKDDRAKGPEIPTSANPTYDELVKAPSPSRVSRSRVAFLTLSGGTFVLAISGWLLLRRRRKLATDGGLSQ